MDVHRIQAAVVSNQSKQIGSHSSKGALSQAVFAADNLFGGGEV
jgi:hypothetical protein